MDYQTLEPMLRKFVAGRFGPDHRLHDGGLLEDGHAGLTFHFSALHDRSAEPEQLVLKLAPPGVRRSGNTDVYRQAPLLRALHAAGLPVPGIRFAAADEAEFGTPYIVMPRLPGRTFVVWDPHAAFGRDPALIAAIWRQTAQVLASLHAFDWRDRLADWETPRDALQEMQRWDSLLLKSPEPEWIALGQALRQRLAAMPPAAAPMGLFHGDFQPGNVLFDDGRLVAVIDWELAGIGDQRLDLGWLLMMADSRSWSANWQPVTGVSPEALVADYEAARGQPAGDLRWHRALAGYRLGAISCLNVRLHRKGQRRDGIWERFADSVPRLFGRGLELMDQIADEGGLR